MTTTTKPETSASAKPSVVHQLTMMKTKTMKPATKTKKEKPLSVSTPETITMEQCKIFFDSEMDIFRTRLKKLSNTPLPSVTTSIVDHPTPTWPLPVPSPLTTSSEGFIAREMAILQTKLKKSFALDMADFHATEHTSTAVTSNANQQQPNKSPDIHPPTPIVPSEK